MSFIDITVDTTVDRYIDLRAPVTDEISHILLANVLQTVSVSGGLV